MRIPFSFFFKSFLKFPGSRVCNGAFWLGSAGNFTRTDLNMPVSVPKRRAGPSAYIRDPPLTALGVFQAQSTGRAMKDAGITFNRVYVSPALRSIQTAAGVLDGRKPILDINLVFVTIFYMALYLFFAIANPLCFCYVCVL